MMELWFGDERRYNATTNLQEGSWQELWFGDERRYNATFSLTGTFSYCCGLVMKEDITQRDAQEPLVRSRCGLVMKEDITQR